MSEETPLVGPKVEMALDSMHRFQELKRVLLDENDVVRIQGKRYITRSGWRKIALVFNIGVEILLVEREWDAESDPSVPVNLIIRVRARARAPNGRFSDETGVCESKEFQKGNLTATSHNIETKAATRAINRAISDLVGGGEITAEEIFG